MSELSFVGVGVGVARDRSELVPPIGSPDRVRAMARAYEQAGFDQAGRTGPMSRRTT